MTLTLLKIIVQLLIFCRMSLSLGLSGFLVIKFRPYIFSRNVTVAMLYPSQVVHDFGWILLIISCQVVCNFTLTHLLRIFTFIT